MKVEIKVPTMGESVLEATVSTILKPSGSFVKEDEEILELETDKVNQVLYAPKSGVLTLQVSKEQTVKIGDVIGYVDTQGQDSQAEQPPAKAAAPPPPTPPPPPKGKEGSARVMTNDFISSLKETPQATQTPQAPPGPKAQIPTATQVTRKRMSGLRKVIAQKLVEAKNTTAMLTTFNEIDMSTVMEIRNREKENFQKKYGVKLGFMSFFVKATVAALKAFPQVNSFIDGDEIVTFETYDIGIAASTERGLMVPVVKGCDTLSFGELELAIERFGKSAREGTISVDDLRGGSFTITNGGVFGSLLSTPILNLPQSAILGMHSIVKRPVVVADQIVIRPMMYVALSYDHRIIDGREAVLFLVKLKTALEDPSRLLLEL
ncbi:MAG TPA: dihydrolipoyllysine-residue succinyltransferase [Rhabdochlamydiaceae bacterium]|jgi:2-oxoglutarate dehydrogenase E2 component (dihydrolipoamide succinyltransferase)